MFFLRWCSRPPACKCPARALMASSPGSNPPKVLSRPSIFSVTVAGPEPGSSRLRFIWSALTSSNISPSPDILAVAAIRAPKSVSPPVLLHLMASGSALPLVPGFGSTTPAAACPSRLSAAGFSTIPLSASLMPFRFTLARMATPPSPCWTRPAIRSPRKTWRSERGRFTSCSGNATAVRSRNGNPCN